MYLDLVIFAIFILIYSSVAGAIERTWLSGAIIFTAFGLLIGPVGLDLISLEVDREAIKVLAELTLALVLFTDAAGADMGVLRKFERLPVRLLLVGLLLGSDHARLEEHRVKADRDDRAGSGRLAARGDRLALSALLAIVAIELPRVLVAAELGTDAVTDLARERA